MRILLFNIEWVYSDLKFSLWFLWEQIRFAGNHGELICRLLFFAPRSFCCVECWWVKTFWICKTLISGFIPRKKLGSISTWCPTFFTYPIFGFGNIYETFEYHATMVTFFALENVLFTDGIGWWDGMGWKIKSIFNFSFRDILNTPHMYILIYIIKSFPHKFVIGFKIWSVWGSGYKKLYLPGGWSFFLSC